MGSRARLLSTIATFSLIAFTSCSNYVHLPPSYLSVSITPRPGSLAVGSSIVFTGTASNNLSVPQWSILDAGYTSNAGTLTAVAGSNTQIIYTAPSTPPIYSATPTGITQGTVTLNASVTNPPGSSSPLTPDSVSFVITAPTVTVGLSPATTFVALGATRQFLGYAVGSVNNTLMWQLSANGIPGGSTLGTINTAGTYVAPSSMPVTGNSVTLTVTSQADPTRTATAVITLQ